MDSDSCATFRSDLAEALAAAFGLDRTPPEADERGDHHRRTRGRVLDLLDSISFRYHPAGDWPGFFEALWERRSELRDDLRPDLTGEVFEHVSVRYHARTRTPRRPACSERS